jgi:hypothetical protein
MTARQEQQATNVSMYQTQFVSSPPEAHSSLGFRAGMRFALIGVAKVGKGRQWQDCRPPSFEKKKCPSSRTMEIWSGHFDEER